MYEVISWRAEPWYAIAAANWLGSCHSPIRWPVDVLIMYRHASP